MLLLVKVVYKAKCDFTTRGREQRREWQGDETRFLVVIFRFRRQNITML